MGDGVVVKGADVNVCVVLPVVWCTYHRHTQHPLPSLLLLTLHSTCLMCECVPSVRCDSALHWLSVFTLVQLVSNWRIDNLIRYRDWHTGNDKQVWNKESQRQWDWNKSVVSSPQLLRDEDLYRGRFPSGGNAERKLTTHIQVCPTIAFVQSLRTRSRSSRKKSDANAGWRKFI